MNKQKNAVTLVELILVISIIAILWIIWIITLSWYLVSVRDSTRIIELENIESSLESFVLKKWYYPSPNEWIDIFYSGWLVWTQWVFWNKVSNIIWYSNDVLDPLTKNSYTYSVKNSKREYSLAWVLEENAWLVSDTWLVPNTYASTIWTKKWTAIVAWNYNWELTTINNNWIDYILALPSIISSDLSSNELVDIITNNKLVYNDFENLPASYTWTVYNLSANIDFSANNLVVFSWSISKLKQSYNQVTLLQNLYFAYSWSIIWKNISVNKIESTDLFSPSPSSKISSLACDMINFKLKYFVECGWVDFITFFVINVLHIDITNLPGTKITAVYQSLDWTFLFWTDAWVAFFDWTNWITYNMQNSDLVHNQISSVTQDNAWNYWIWTNNWLNKLDLCDESLYTCPNPPDLTNTTDDVWISYGNDVLVSTHIQYIYRC